MYPRTIPSLSGSVIALLKIMLFQKYKSFRHVHGNIKIYLVIKVVHRNLNSSFFIFNVENALSKDRSDRVNKGSRAN